VFHTPVVLPGERRKYPEHTFHIPFDQPGSLMNMVLYLHKRERKKPRKMVRS
jgi:hypothetical protein